jgi:hypothetical protein
MGRWSAWREVCGKVKEQSRELSRSVCHTALAVRLVGGG